MVPISTSVVINTLNEERNLANALRSVKPWASEIIVVDMNSEDRTVAIAHEYGAKVFNHDRIGFADPARAFAVSQSAGDWILILDADELVPPALSAKLLDIARTDAADVVNIPWLNYLLGAPLMHTAWGPEQDKHPRFFKRGFVNTTGTVHDFLKPVVGARIYDLQYEPGLGIAHFNYLDSTHFLEKLNRYTTIEAQSALERGESSTVWRCLFRAFREFAVRYVWRQGYKDGWRGFYLSLFMVFYRVAAYAKLKELEVLGDRATVIARYQKEAEKWLAGDVS